MSDHNSKYQSIHLKDLIEVKEWQAIQDNFSAVTEVCLRTLDAEGKLFTSPSKEPRICTQIIKSEDLKEKICGRCLPTFLGGKAVVDSNFSFTCYAGLHNFIMPLRVNGGGVLGYVILGPVILVMRKPKAEYDKYAEKLGIDPEEFWEGILEVRTISFNGIRSLVNLVRDVAEYILKTAYQSAADTKADDIDPERLNRLLSLLLDVAFQVTGADIGSVMFLDKESNDLTIRSARGLPHDIVKQTRVKIGQGISGTAAKERAAFLLNKGNSDNRVKSFLQRPYISSSMVVPIVVNDRAIGVVNVGAFKNSAVKFDSVNLELVQKLIKLASLAITS